MSWIPTLFAAEAIPSAMITFVALLMFLQLDQGWGMATLLTGLLTLPWIVRPLLQHMMRRAGHLALQLRIVETAIFAAIVWLALSFEGGGQYLLWNVFSALLCLALLCAWHEMAARHHYGHLLRLPFQRYYNLPKMFASQTAVILTYGIMIVGVGFLEVFYHNRHNAMTLSWSTAVYVLAGGYLLFLAFNLFAIPGSSKSKKSYRHGSDKAYMAYSPYKPSSANPSYPLLPIAFLFLLLLPQSLMFHARVLFFISARARGGLGASLQWLGLAQGTVGVIAFTFGLVLGYWLVIHGGRVHRHLQGSERICHTHTALSPDGRSRISRRALIVATVLLPISPLIYWHLSFLLPATLFPLCVATFLAQFLFGFGLNACAPYVRTVSGKTYANATGYLYIPAIALAMLLPASLSGFMLEHISFQTFFAINALCIIPAWGIGALGLYRSNCEIAKQ